METPYRAVSFSQHDPITKEEMDQLNANYQWIHDNTPVGLFYKRDSKPVQEMLVIVAGRALIKKHPKMDHAKVKVNLRKAFAPDCRPAVTTGLVTNSVKTFCTVHGPKGANYPTATGFEISVEKSYNGRDDKIKKPFYVHWMAMGYGVNRLDEI